MALTGALLASASQNPIHLGVFAAVAAASVWYFRSTSRSKRLPPLVPYSNPFLGNTKEYMAEPHDFLNTVFDKYGPVIRVNLFGRIQYLIDAPLVPTAMIHKGLDSEKGANAIQFLDVLVGLGIEYKMEDTHRLVLKAVGSKLEVFIDRIRPHIESIISKTLGSEETTKVDNPFVFIRTIIAKAMCNSFVGEELGEDREMIHVFTNVTEVVSRIATVGASSLIGLLFPPFRRWRAMWEVKRSKVLSPYTDILTRKLIPELERRVRLRRSCASVAEWENIRPVDMLQSIIDERGFDLTDRDRAVGKLPEMINLLLFLIFASVHLTSVHLTWVVNSLAYHSEVHRELMEELKTVMHAHDGVLNEEALKDLTLMDSFLRETFRTRYDCIGGSQRVASEDVELEGGYLLPKGSLINPITFRSHQSRAIQTDRKDPLEFAPWSHTNSATRTSVSYLQFGMGRHACPGRFLAVSEAKIIVAYLLGRYEISLHEPEKGIQMYMRAFTFSMAPTGAIVFKPRSEKEALLLR